MNHNIGPELMVLADKIRLDLVETLHTGTDAHGQDSLTLQQMQRLICLHALLTTEQEDRDAKWQAPVVQNECAFVLLCFNEVLVQPEVVGQKILMKMAHAIILRENLYSFTPQEMRLFDVLWCLHGALGLDKEVYMSAMEMTARAFEVSVPQQRFEEARQRIRVQLDQVREHSFERMIKQALSLPQDAPFPHQVSYPSVQGDEDTVEMDASMPDAAIFPLWQRFLEVFYAPCLLESEVFAKSSWTLREAKEFAHALLLNLQNDLSDSSDAIMSVRGYFENKGSQNPMRVSHLLLYLMGEVKSEAAFKAFRSGLYYLFFQIQRHAFELTCEKLPSFLCALPGHQSKSSNVQVLSVLSSVWDAPCMKRDLILDERILTVLDWHEQTRGAGVDTEEGYGISPGVARKRPKNKATDFGAGSEKRIMVDLLSSDDEDQHVMCEQCPSGSQRGLGDVSSVPSGQDRRLPGGLQAMTSSSFFSQGQAATTPEKVLCTSDTQPVSFATDGGMALQSSSAETCKELRDPMPMQGGASYSETAESMMKALEPTPSSAFPRGAISSTLSQDADAFFFWEQRLDQVFSMDAASIAFDNRCDVEEAGLFLRLSSMLQAPGHSIVTRGLLEIHKASWRTSAQNNAQAPLMYEQVLLPSDDPLDLTETQAYAQKHQARLDAVIAFWSQDFKDLGPRSTRVKTYSKLEGGQIFGHSAQDGHEKGPQGALTRMVYREAIEAFDRLFMVRRRPLRETDRKEDGQVLDVLSLQPEHQGRILDIDTMLVQYIRQAIINIPTRAERGVASNGLFIPTEWFGWELFAQSSLGSVLMLDESLPYEMRKRVQVVAELCAVCVALVPTYKDNLQSYVNMVVLGDRRTEEDNARMQAWEQALFESLVPDLHAMGVLQRVGTFCQRVIEQFYGIGRNAHGRLKDENALERAKWLVSRVTELRQKYNRIATSFVSMDNYQLQQFPVELLRGDICRSKRLQPFAELEPYLKFITRSGTVLLEGDRNVAYESTAVTRTFQERLKRCLETDDGFRARFLLYVSEKYAVDSNITIGCYVASVTGEVYPPFARACEQTMILRGPMQYEKQVESHMTEIEKAVRNPAQFVYGEDESHAPSL